MEKSNRVNILQVCKISPSSSNSNSASKFSLPLSCFDWSFFKFRPVELIVFYQLIDSHPPFLDTILPKLKHSLSLTLQHFLPLVGNLVWPQDSPKPFFLYTPNDSVSFTVAEIDHDSEFFNRISSTNNAHKITDYHLLIPTIRSSSSSSDNKTPVMALQVTKFPNDHGFSIGFSGLHVLFDAKSVSIFMKAWAHINKSSSSSSLLPDLFTPRFERPDKIIQMKYPTSDSISQTKSLMFESFHSLESNSNNFHGTFELTSTHIEKLKKRVLDYYSMVISKEILHLSSFVVAYAYALTCLVKAKEGESEIENYCILLTVDARRFLNDPPISSNYFGNCLGFSGEFVQRRELIEDDAFPNIAMKISNLVLGLKSNCITIPDRSSDQREESIPGVQLCSVGSSPNFKFYEIDFGWGKAKKIEMLSLESHNILLKDTPSAGDGSIQVGIILPHHQMDIFSSLFLKRLN